MADNFLFAQLQPFTLYGAGAIIGDTSFTLTSFKTIDGVNLTMANFGAIGYVTIDPGNGTSEEQVSFASIVQNANGTATLGTAKNVLFISPYTETTGLAKTHTGGAVVVVSNTAGFYNKLTSKSDDETISGIWTFTNPNYPRMDTTTPPPTDPEQLATKKYVDDTATSGAPDASTTAKGIVQQATVSQLNAGTGSGSTGAVLFGSPADFASSIYGLRLPTSGQKLALPGNNADIAVGTGNTYVTQTGLQKRSEVYAVTATGNDAYVVTLSPVPASITAGFQITVLFDVANGGAATLNPNSIGAASILRPDGSALANNDILAAQTITLTSNGTAWLLPAVLPKFFNGVATRAGDAANGVQNIAHGLGKAPSRILSNASKTISSTALARATGVAVGSGNTGLFNSNVNGTNMYSGNSAVYSLTIWDDNGTNKQEAIITADATNIILTWTKTGTPNSNTTDIMVTAEV